MSFQISCANGQSFRACSKVSCSISQKDYVRLGVILQLKRRLLSGILFHQHSQMKNLCLGSAGDPLYDLIPIHLDVFRGDPSFLKQFLQSYKLPLLGPTMCSESEEHGKCCRLSYRAIKYRCYCILHEENVLGAIFSIWKELRQAQSWEEVEQTVWGELNSYPC